MADKKITELTEKLAAAISDADEFWFGANDTSGTEASFKIKLSELASAIASGAVTTYERVADKSSRLASPSFNGFESFVETNNVIYVWRSSAWEIKDAFSVGTTTERDSLSEHEDDQMFFDTDLNEFLRWDSTATGTDKWVATGGIS